MTTNSKNNLQSIIKENFRKTSVRGLPRIINSESLLIKVMWIVTISVLFVFLSIQITNLIIQYRQAETLINTLPWKKNRHFPSVTICNLNPFSLIYDLRHHNLSSIMTPFLYKTKIATMAEMTRLEGLITERETEIYKEYLLTMSSYYDNIDDHFRKHLGAGPKIASRHQEQRYRQLMLNAFAENTRRTYKSQISSWLQFCQSRGFQPQKAKPHHVVSYITYLSLRIKSANSIKSYINAVALTSKCLGVCNPTDDISVSLILRGVQRTLCASTQSKEPLSAQHLLKLREVLNLKRPRESSFWAACLTGWFGMLRKANLVVKSNIFNSGTELSAANIKFCAEGALVSVSHSKTNQFRKRLHKIFLPSIFVTGKKTHLLCPVAALLNHFSINKIAGGDSKTHLFSFSENGLTKRWTSQAFSSFLSEKLSTAGLGKLKFSGHSLRKGGATAAFEAGVSKLDIMRMGDWRSDSVLRYIRPTSRHQQETAKQLGAQIGLVSMH